MGKKLDQKVEVVACAFIALVCSTINPLAVLMILAPRKKKITVDDLADFDALKDQFEQADLTIQAYVVFTLLAATGVYFYMNKVYLFPALHDCADLWKRSRLTICHVILTSPTSRRPLEPQYRVKFSEVLLLSLAFLTGLAFAKITSKGLLFFGKSGEWVSFICNFLAFFSTRFVAANHVFGLTGHQEREWNRRSFLHRLRQLAPDEQILRDPVTVDEFVNTLRNTLKGNLNNEGWSQRPKVFWRRMLFCYFFPGFGVLFACLMLPSVLIVVMPSSVEGIELITGYNIGAMDNYKSAKTCVAAFPAVILTLFFYYKSMKTLPQQLALTFQLAASNQSTRNQSSRHQSTGHQFAKNCRQHAELFVLTSLAFFASCLGSIGFWIAAEVDLQEDRYSYLKSLEVLGSWGSGEESSNVGREFEHAIPTLFCLSLVAVLWAHILDEINQKKLQQILQKIVASSSFADGRRTWNAWEITLYLLKNGKLQITDSENANIEQYSQQMTAPHQGIGTHASPSQISFFRRCYQFIYPLRSSSQVVPGRVTSENANIEQYSQQMIVPHQGIGTHASPSQISFFRRCYQFIYPPRSSSQVVPGRVTAEVNASQLIEVSSRGVQYHI